MTSPSSPVDSIAKAMEGVKKVADGHYCRALDQFQKTPCLGAEYKMENGLFGVAEHEAHAGANKTMGHHFGMYEAIRLIEPALAEVLDLARQAEAMKREMAEKDERIAALEKALKPFAEEAGCYDPDTGDNDDSVWATPAYFKIRDLRRARALIGGGNAED